MTLEQAIDRYTNNAEYERRNGSLQGCMEFRQLEEWLKDYKRLLEQEPCTDVVSRQAVLKIFEDRFIELHKAHRKDTQLGVNWCINTLKDMPPVRPQLCDDVICREELLKAIDTWDKFGCNADTKLVPYQDHYIPYIHYDDVVKCIKGMPSVNPQEQTGHWIYDNIANNWRCDKCGETPKTMGYVGTADFMAEHFKFCNHCGAKMVEPQESEDKE